MYLRHETYVFKKLKTIIFIKNRENDELHWMFNRPNSGLNVK